MTNPDHSTGKPLRLEVDTFRNTATALEGAATLLRTSVHESLDGLAHTGVDGEAPIDIAYADLLPDLLQMLEETIDGISNGLSDEANALTEGAEKYDEIADDVRELGSFEEGEH